jgi:hypothetical protein
LALLIPTFACPANTAVQHSQVCTMFDKLYLLLTKKYYKYIRSRWESKRSK